jgi:hypothetical protein
VGVLAAGLYLNSVTPMVTLRAITGDNTATWNPPISVSVPGGETAGTYSVTITHSVVLLGLR